MRRLLIFSDLPTVVTALMKLLVSSSDHNNFRDNIQNVNIPNFIISFQHVYTKQMSEEVFPFVKTHKILDIFETVVESALNSVIQICREKNA